MTQQHYRCPDSESPSIVAKDDSDLIWYAEQLLLGLQAEGGINGNLDRLTGELCTLMEALLPPGRQCEALKENIKASIRRCRESTNINCTHGFSLIRDRFTPLSEDDLTPTQAMPE